ncbi:DUF563 domain-containing protein [Nocardioides sp. cx-173]|uniref:glycosyltransferase family 61 protein n=1 Tax=Nocardioides sp. cx-173 TaxID=2898796 RepID=UPI001E4E91D0|nr:glycosyltransferase 61 family protein [Nocardioides sp. cx-173]MCD4524763.1 glycosyltransferase family 61 protein [Nocardioides sp. cx-173]UGB43271.1 glycosyltransferase family 61 protein [Nocardioides sp. cx-173]
MPWARPESPVQRPQEPLVERVVTDAVLTRTTHGNLAVLGRPDRWIRGAVHTRGGAVVSESQRVCGGGGERYAACDPALLKDLGQQAPGRRLRGTWLYGGHWMPMFGHFITETLTSLWTETSVDGLVFHSWLAPRGEVSPWQQRLVELAGRQGLDVRVVGTRHAVDRLVVAERPYVVNGWARPEAVAVWRTVASGVTSDRSPDRVYFSRTRHNADAVNRGRPVRSSPQRDRELDQDFERAGFAVFFPEELSVDQQIGLAAGARVIGGNSGSALHLSAFASHPAYVVEVGDERAPHGGLRNQQVIDAARGHHHAFVPAARRAADILDELELMSPPTKEAR